VEHHDEGTAVRVGRVNATWFASLAAIATASLAPSPTLAAPAPAPVQVPKGNTDQAPPDGDADPPDEPQTAAEWYARGYSLGKEGKNEAAAEAFLRSYELQPTPEALYNAALARENAGAYVEAIATYQRFLAQVESNPEGSSRLVPVAERSIDALMTKVGVLKGVRYEDERPPKQLLVDGEVVALDAFPLLIMPGEVEITVIDETDTARDERYELLAGESLVLDLRALLPPPPDPDRGPDITLGPEPEPEPNPPPYTAEQAERDAGRAKRLRAASFSLAGLTGASGVASLTLGLLTAAARRDLYEDTCYDQDDGVCPPDFDIGTAGRHNRSYERYAIGTTVAVGLTAGFAVSALVTGLLSRRYAKRAKRAHDAPQVEITPIVSGVLVRF